MVKSSTEFRRIDGVGGVFSAQSGALRCSAIALKSGGLCLFSPVAGLGDTALASLVRLGDVAFLLAPNHYHNKGLAEYRAAFPNASLCASPAAQTRLTKITGLAFDGLNGLAAELPDGMEVLVPEGLKTGEAWIRIAGPQAVAWLVVDAFSGPKGKPGSVAQEPELLGTFPKFGVGDRARYVAWVKQQIQRDQPYMIVPCHGDITRGPDLTARLLALIDQEL